MSKNELYGSSNSDRIRLFLFTNYKITFLLFTLKNGIYFFKSTYTMRRKVEEWK